MCHSRLVLVERPLRVEDDNQTAMAEDEVQRGFSAKATGQRMTAVRNLGRCNSASSPASFGHGVARNGKFYHLGITSVATH